MLFAAVSSGLRFDSGYFFLWYGRALFIFMIGLFACACSKIVKNSNK